MRCILGILSLAKQHGVAVVEEACATAIDLEVENYRFVRRYLERPPDLAAPCRSADRELTEYHDCKT
jgi:hypothetical protein